MQATTLPVHHGRANRLSLLCLVQGACTAYGMGLFNGHVGSCNEYMAPTRLAACILFYLPAASFLGHVMTCIAQSLSSPKAPPCVGNSNIPILYVRDLQYGDSTCCWSCSPLPSGELPLPTQCLLEQCCCSQWLLKHGAVGCSSSNGLSVVQRSCTSGQHTVL